MRVSLRQSVRRVGTATTRRTAGRRSRGDAGVNGASAVNGTAGRAAAEENVANARPRQVRPTPEAPRGGVTEDRAWYRCCCGYFFEAPVSSSVSCPRCGDEQAW